MSTTVDLEKLTVEEVKAQLRNGKSAQKLLSDVVCANTSQNKDLISKQTELVQFCINNGASLKDEFKEANGIPASFIENNLPLIASHYYPTEVLQHITMHLDGLNDQLSLITTLIDDYWADACELSFVSSELSFKSIELLLSRGMNGGALLSAAFVNNNEEKQKALFDLAFKHGATTSFFKDRGISLDISVQDCNESTFKLLMDNYKISAQDLLNIVVLSDTSKYNQETQEYESSQEFIAKQTALTKFLIGEGAKLQGICDFSSDFFKNNPSLAKEAKEARYFALTDFAPKDIEIDPIVLNLMKGIFVKKDSSEEYTHETFMEFCYALHKVMNASHTIARVLSYVSQMPNLEIYIDGEGVSRDSLGVYGNNGKIYIQHSMTDRVSTIVHECFHKVFDTLYNNDSHPYSQNDIETKKQVSNLIESDLLVQELVPEYGSWFAMKYSKYEKEEYNVELFTFLITALTSTILRTTELESGIGTREFTKGAWEILQKIVATIPNDNGTIYKPEDAPEYLMLSEEENNDIQKAFISNKADKLFTINPNLDSNSIDFLLSKGMKGDVLLTSAFRSKDKEKQKELFNLAFKFGADTSSLKNLDILTLNVLIENCHKDIFKFLIDNYKVSVQDLLNIIVRAEVNQYNQATQKSEPRPELIHKQSNWVQSCCTNGASLKDGFENINDIPASFIENNLPLIIESKYESTEILQHIVTFQYQLNNPLSLITKLIDVHKADAHKVSDISSELDSSSIELLLSRGMNGGALLSAAFKNSDAEKQKALFDLAFKHGATTNSFKDLYISLENCNEGTFKLLMDNYKVSVQDLLNTIIRTSTSQYNQATQKYEPSQELIHKQSNWVQSCCTKGAKLKDAFENIYYIPKSFIENNLSLIASHYDPTEVLSYISRNTYELNNPLSLITKLIDDHKADAHKVSDISSELDSSSIELLLSRGMNGGALLSAAFKNSDAEKQKALFDLAFKHGATTNSFKDLYISVENCNEGTFKLLMDDYKVSSQDLLNTIIRTSTSQYNQATQKYEPSQELIATQTRLKKFLIENGAKLEKTSNLLDDIPKDIVKLAPGNDVLDSTYSHNTATVEDDVSTIGADSCI